MNFQDFYQQINQEWQEKSSYRQLRTSAGIDFCSNDYLSLSNSLELRTRVMNACQDLPLGSTGSRLLSGHHQLTDNLEAKLSEWGRVEASLYFPSGYQANLSLLSALLSSDAQVFSDQRIHASMIDGIKLSGCPKWIWKHNDLNHLEELLKAQTQKSMMSFVCVESIYSMKGSFAPLVELVELCEKYQAHLIVDEAHATGLFAQTGQGRVVELGLEDRVFARVHTAGKAMGLAGAWVAGSAKLKDFLINKARGFIYSTAPSLWQQAALLEGVEFFEKYGCSLSQEFSQIHAEFQSQLIEVAEQQGWGFTGQGSPVSCVVVRANPLALQLSMQLQEAGLDVRAVRPPTVPESESLLRITCPLKRTAAEKNHLLSILSLKGQSV